MNFLKNNKLTKKTPEEMTDAEMHDRLGILKSKIAWNNKYIIPIAIGVGAFGVALAAAGGLALIALPFAPMTVFGLFAAVAPMIVGGGTIERDSHVRELQRLSNENQNRIYIAEKRQQQATAKQQAAEKRAVAESTLRLRKEFDAALAAMAEGRGIDRDMTVRRPLQLKINNTGMR